MRLRGLTVALVSISVLAGPLAMALEPTKGISQYVGQSWEADQGLPQNSIFAIVQTADSYLWLATQEGLVRFDGARFTVFDRRTTPLLTQPEIRSLYEDEEKNLWIGTSRAGLLRESGGTFVALGAKDGLPSLHVAAVTGDRRGNVWVGTSRGLCRVRIVDSTLTTFTMADGLPHDQVEAVLVDRAGNVWVGTDGGLVKLRDGKVLATYTARTGLPHDQINTLHEDHEGSVWAGTPSGLVRLRGGRVDVFTKRDGLSDDDILHVSEDRAQNLWIGTKGGGLNRFREGRFTSYTAKDGLSTNAVSFTHEDREGNLWLGTFGKGLSRLKDGNFTSYTTKDGLSHDFVWSVYEDHAGDIWIGTYGGGLARMRGGAFSAFTTAEGLASNHVYGTFEDKAGVLWIGTEGGGLSRLDANRDRFLTLSVKDGLSRETVRAVFADREKSIWVGFDRPGLNRIIGDKITSYGVKDGVPDARVVTFHEDREGTLWIATDGGGLLKRRGDRFEAITTKDGLSLDHVSSIHEDKDGTLWLGTVGGGMNRMRGAQITAFTAKDGLFDDNVHAILEDGKDNLWLSCNKGIFRVSKRELDDFATGKVSAFRSVYYGKADGMRNSECNGGSPAGFRAKDGRLWFPTMQGVVVIDPDHLKKNDLAPPVVVEQILVNRAPVDVTKNARLAPDSRDFEFQYTALSFAAPERVQFKYKLEGFDHAFIEAGSRRVAYYTNLPAGDYTFRVIACNDDGVWNEAGASASFSVAQHFYRTSAFYGAVMLALALLGTLGYRVRVQKLKGAAEILEGKVAERTLLLTIANRSLEEKDHRIGEDLAQARSFQQRILPVLPRSRKIEFATVYEPADAVGGDIYDVCEYAPGRFRVFIADTTGHGVQASLRTMVLKTEYDRLKFEASEPGALLSALNRTLYAVYPGLEMRCSACCFDIEPYEDGMATVRYANAAHPPLLHVRRGDAPGESHVKEIYQPGPFLGMVQEIVLLPHTFKLKKGERLLAYTDGICEQENGIGRAFGIDRVANGLAKRDLALKDALDAILRDFREFCAEKPLSDDVALVGAECL